MKRTFVLLREDDPLLVPSTNKLKHLSDSGRVKELVFTYTATSRHVIEIIVNNFPALLTNGNISREVSLSPNLFLFQPRNYFSIPDCSFAGLLANQFDICGPLRSYVRRHIKGPIQTSKMRPETGNESSVVIFFSLFPVEWAPCDACLLVCLT